MGPIITVSRDFNETWIKPKQVIKDESFIKRHLEDRILVKRIPIKTKEFTGTIELTKNLETFDYLLKVILVVMLIAGIFGLIFSFRWDSYNEETIIKCSKYNRYDETY